MPNSKLIINKNNYFNKFLSLIIVGSFLLLSSCGSEKSGDNNKEYLDTSKQVSLEILSIFSSEAGQATLEWNVSSNNNSLPIKYEIHASKTENFTTSNSTLKALTTGVLNATINDLEEGVTYYFIIKAYSSANNISKSPYQSKIIAQSNKSPSAPIIVDLSSVYEGNASIDWSPSSDDGTANSAIKYEIHASKTENFTPDNSTLMKSTSNEFSAIIGNLDVGGIYYFVVMAYDDTGLSSTSSYASVKISEVIITRTTANIKQTSTALDQTLAQNLDENGTLSSNAKISISNADNSLEKNDIIVDTKNGGMLLKVIDVGNAEAQAEPATLSDAYENISFSSKTTLVDNEDVSSFSSRSLSRTTTYSRSKGIERIHTWPKSGFQIISSTKNNKGVQLRGLKKRGIKKRGIFSHVKFDLDRNTAIKPGKDIKIDFKVKADDGYSFNSVKINSLPSNGKKTLSKKNFTLKLKNGAKKNDNGELIEAEYSLHIRTSKKHKSLNPYVVKLTADVFCTFCLPDIFDLNVYVTKDATQDLGQNIDSSIIKNKIITLNAEGKLNFDPSFDISAEIESFKVKSAKIIIEGNVGVDLELALKASKAINLEGSVSIFKKKFTKIIAAGGIPIVITGSVSFDLESTVDMDGKVSITNSFTNNFNAKVGLKYENDKWTPIGDSSYTQRYTFKVESAAGIEMEVRLIPRINVEFYRVVGFGGSIEPYLTSAAKLEGFFEYIQDSAFKSSDANYRFTDLNAKVGVDIKARIDLGIIMDKRTIGLAWPSRDRETLGEVASLGPWAMVSLPSYSVLSSLDLSKNQINMSINETSGSWLGKANVLQGGFWKIVPSQGATITPKSNFREATVTFKSQPFKSEHKIYFTGYNKFGSFIRQYEFDTVDLRSYSYAPSIENCTRLPAKSDCQ